MSVTRRLRSSLLTNTHEAVRSEAEGADIGI